MRVCDQLHTGVRLIARLVTVFMQTHNSTQGDIVGINKVFILLFLYTLATDHRHHCHHRCGRLAASQNAHVHTAQRSPTATDGSYASTCCTRVNV
jgi:hypothetical protein